MKSLLSFLLVFSLFSSTSFSQSPEKNPAPYIEVTGYAEKKIVPDEIYVSITIKEKTGNRSPLSVDEQLATLKSELKALDIDLDLLTVTDLQADYIRLKWSKKEVVAQSEFELKLSTVKQLADVFEKLEELKIEDAYIARTCHSLIKELKKETEIAAIQDAKSKADYLLTAIGQERGSALIITDQDEIILGNQNTTEYKGSFNAVGYGYTGMGLEQSKSFGSVSFKKLILKSSIYVKFEVK